MATKLEKPVTREVTVKDVFGEDAPILVTLTGSGITLRGKGTKREVKISYLELAAASTPPSHMPAKFSANRLGWFVKKKEDVTE
jgi:hypothetical protein